MIQDQTAASNRVTLREKIGFSCGATVTNTAPAALHVLLNPIFNISLGLNPALIAMVSFVQTMWYTMIAPLVGQFSDNLRSKIGRRRPLMLIVAVPLALSFSAIWFFPRDLTPGELIVYLLVASLLFLSIYAFYAIPFQALLMEASEDYDERTRINMLTQSWVFLVSIAIQWIFPFTQWKVFGDTIVGVRYFAVFFGLFLVAVALLPFFLNREPMALLAMRQKRTSLVENIRAAFANKPFVVITLMRAIFTFTYNIVGSLGLYLNYYLVFGGDIRRGALMQSINGTVFQIAAIGALFLFRILAIRNGKGAALSVAGWILAIGSLSKLFVYVPNHPWGQLVVYVCNGIAGAGSVMLSNACLAEIADYEELRSGIRREGTYASVLGWFDRVGNSTGTLISGFILVWVGFDAKLGGAQSPGTLNLMRIAYFAIPFIGAVASIFLIKQYSLNREKCHQIRQDLHLHRLHKVVTDAAAMT